MHIGVRMDIFIIMPIYKDDDAEALYKHCIKELCASQNLVIKRSDELFTANPVMTDVFGAINESLIVIADISGCNPNVMYELGIAHFLKPNATIVITHDDYDNLPFDVAHWRVISYSNSIRGEAAFKEKLSKTLDSILNNVKLVNKREFESILAFLDSYTNRSLLCSLVGLYDGVQFGPNDMVDISGRKGEEKTSYAAPGDFLMEGFILAGYVELVGNYYVLTKKGKAFAEILDQKAFVCEHMDVRPNDFSEPEETDREFDSGPDEPGNDSGDH